MGYKNLLMPTGAYLNLVLENRSLLCRCFIKIMMKAQQISLELFKGPSQRTHTYMKGK